MLGVHFKSEKTLFQIFIWIGDNEISPDCGIHCSLYESPGRGKAEKKTKSKKHLLQNMN